MVLLVDPLEFLYHLYYLVFDQALEGTGSAWWWAHLAIPQAKVKGVCLSLSGSLVGSLSSNYGVDDVYVLGTGPFLLVKTL